MSRRRKESCWFGAPCTGGWRRLRAMPLFVGVLIGSACAVSHRSDSGASDAFLIPDIAVDASATPDATVDGASDLLASGDITDSGLASGAIASGPEPVIDAFPATSGILLVTRDRVSLLARSDGHELSRWTAPHPIACADFDGATLAVADAATLTALSPDLSIVS